MDDRARAERNERSGILIFAGTTEGRLLTEFLDRNGIPAHVCVATEYGGELLEETSGGPAESCHILHAGRLDLPEMEELIRREHISTVIDATHPYAAAVSENIRVAVDAVSGCCMSAAGTPTDGASGNSIPADGGPGSTPVRYIRLLRSSSDAEEKSGLYFPSVEDSVEYLKGTSGRILAVTGSKELRKYTEIPDYQERLYVRVLSTAESVEKAVNAGLSGAHLIAMQGPFSVEANVALIHQTHAEFLVTKESGAAGGFPEKVRAAQITGVKLIVIGRPLKNETGLSLREVKALLAEQMRISPRRDIFLAGIGMGNPRTMTEEVRGRILKSDLLIGAERMLEAAKNLREQSARASAQTAGAFAEAPDILKEYVPEKICDFLLNHPEYEHVTVLLSGDPGFYSGAKKLSAALSRRFPETEVTVMPGISSAVYLGARTGISWDDAHLCSIHGRSENLVGAVRTHRKVFTLVGKQDSFRELCGNLIACGLGGVKMTAGANLSYPDEHIFIGDPEKLMKEDTGDLLCLFIQNAHPTLYVSPGIPDTAFIRILGNTAMSAVPMTKSEVRAVAISKLRLSKNSVVWDVGAGTGSVSVECALLSSEGQVFAIEKREEAVALIEENRNKFACANLNIVPGSAPEALRDLPAPTHVFIGGSSGNMKEILEIAVGKNRDVRVVIDVIALESVNASMAALKELPFGEADVAEIMVAKSKKVGPYHMMMGQNPVYIISADGQS